MPPTCRKGTRVTTTTTLRYRAQTDPTIKTWHLGAARARRHVLLRREADRARTIPGRLRSSVPADRRHYTTDDDVSKVTCGGCKRSREYAKATAADRPRRAAPWPGRAPEPPPCQDRATRAPTAPPPTRRRRLQVTGRVRGRVIEADPETGLPRIKPEYAAKAERVAADQAARNAQ